MKVHRTVLAAALLLCSLAFSARAASDIPSDPGYHPALPLPDSKLCTYDLYLPPNYDVKSKTRCPVLIVLGYNNEGSRRWFDEMGLVDWTETSNAIVVVVNTSFADFVNTNMRSTQRDLTIMDHYMKLIDAIPQVHPNLRFVVTEMGEYGASRAWAVAARFPQKVSGIVLGPQLYVLGTGQRLAPVDKNLSVAVLHLDPIAWIKAHPSSIGFFMYDNYDAWEERVGKVLSSPQVGAHPILRISTSDQMLSSKPLARALTFLLDSASLANPNLTKVEADTARAGIVARANQAAALDDPEARYTALDPFVHVPVFVKSTEGKQALTAWTKAVYDVAAKKDVFARYRFLRALMDFDPLFASEPEHATLAKKLTELVADPTVRAGIVGQDKLTALRISLSRAYSEGNTATCQDAMSDLDKLIAKYPNTTIAEDGAALKQLAQNELGMISRIRTVTTRPAVNGGGGGGDVIGPAN